MSSSEFDPKLSAPNQLDPQADWEPQIVSVSSPRVVEVRFHDKAETMDSSNAPTDSVSSISISSVTLLDAAPASSPPTNQLSTPLEASRHELLSTLEPSHDRFEQASVSLQPSRFEKPSASFEPARPEQRSAHLEASRRELLSTLEPARLDARRPEFTVSPSTVPPLSSTPSTSPSPYREHKTFSPPAQREDAQYADRSSEQPASLETSDVIQVVPAPHVENEAYTPEAPLRISEQNLQAIQESPAEVMPNPSPPPPPEERVVEPEERKAKELLYTSNALVLNNDISQQGFCPYGRFPSERVGLAAPAPKSDDTPSRPDEAPAVIQTGPVIGHTTSTSCIIMVEASDDCQITCRLRPLPRRAQSVIPPDKEFMPLEMVKSQNKRYTYAQRKHDHFRATDGHQLLDQADYDHQQLEHQPNEPDDDAEEDLEPIQQVRNFSRGKPYVFEFNGLKPGTKYEGSFFLLNPKIKVEVPADKRMTRPDVADGKEEHGEGPAKDAQLEEAQKAAAMGVDIIGQSSCKKGAKVKPTSAEGNDDEVQGPSQEAKDIEHPIKQEAKMIQKACEQVAKIDFSELGFEDPRKATFTTMSSPDKLDFASFKFGVVSCNKAKWTNYHPDEKDMWADLLENHKREPFHCLLHIGDQMYGDHDAEAKDESSSYYRARNLLLQIKDNPNKFEQTREAVLEMYRHEYRRTWSHPPTQQMLASCPNYMIWDDHEIRDNFGDLEEDRMPGNAERWVALCARQVYYEYQRQLWDPTIMSRFTFSAMDTDEEREEFRCALKLQHDVIEEAKRNGLEQRLKERANQTLEQHNQECIGALNCPLMAETIPVPTVTAKDLLAIRRACRKHMHFNPEMVSQSASDLHFEADHLTEAETEELGRDPSHRIRDVRMLQPARRLKKKMKDKWHSYRDKRDARKQEERGGKRDDDEAKDESKVRWKDASKPSRQPVADPSDSWSFLDADSSKKMVVEGVIVGQMPEKTSFWTQGSVVADDRVTVDDKGRGYDYWMANRNDPVMVNSVQQGVMMPRGHSNVAQDMAALSLDPKLQRADDGIKAELVELHLLPLQPSPSPQLAPSSQPVIVPASDAVPIPLPASQQNLQLLRAQSESEVLYNSAECVDEHVRSLQGPLGYDAKGEMGCSCSFDPSYFDEKEHHLSDAKQMGLEAKSQSESGVSASALIIVREFERQWRAHQQELIKQGKKPHSEAELIFDTYTKLAPLSVDQGGVRRDFFAPIFGTVGIMFLDTRGGLTFYAPPLTSCMRKMDQQHHQSRLGSRQWELIMHCLADKTGPYSKVKTWIVIATIPFFVYDTFFSNGAGLWFPDLEGHWCRKEYRHELAKIFELLAEWKDRSPDHALCLLGGDIHMGGFAHVYKSGKYFASQLVTSPIANDTSKGVPSVVQRGPLPRAQAVKYTDFTYKQRCYYTERNYGEVRVFSNLEAKDRFWLRLRAVSGWAQDKCAGAWHSAFYWGVLRPIGLMGWLRPLHKYQILGNKRRVDTRSPAQKRKDDERSKKRYPRHPRSHRIEGEDDDDESPHHHSLRPQGGKALSEKEIMERALRPDLIEDEPSVNSQSSVSSVSSVSNDRKEEMKS